jgi:ribonuclease Z
MELVFLGTGAAFSLERYNGAVCVDRRLLLDGGAPLLPHLHRAGIDPAGIEVLFLSHFHGDHVAGLIPFMAFRAFLPEPRPLTVVGSEGTEERLDALLDAAWGPDEWRVWKPRIPVRHQLAGEGGEVAGVRFETVALRHGSARATGYRLHLDGRILAYAGDSQATGELDLLCEGADVAVTEATGPTPMPTHTSWPEAEALAARHPGTRFLFNHIYAGSPAGAVSDLEVITV